MNWFLPNQCTGFMETPSDPTPLDPIHNFHNELTRFCHRRCLSADCAEKKQLEGYKKKPAAHGLHGKRQAWTPIKRVLRVLRVIKRFKRFKRFKGLRAGKRQAWTPIRSHWCVALGCLLAAGWSMPRECLSDVALWQRYCLRGSAFREAFASSLQGFKVSV